MDGLLLYGRNGIDGGRGVVGMMGFDGRRRSEVGVISEMRMFDLLDFCGKVSTVSYSFYILDVMSKSFREAMNNG